MKALGRRATCALLITSNLMVSGCASGSEAWNGGVHMIAGSIPLDRGPDGNSVLIDAPEGLILIDTGRHPEHSAKLLGYARERVKPIAAILNTHWHLDHTTGNWDIRKAYPRAPVYATTAIEGALVGYLPRGRERRLKTITNPTTAPDRRAQAVRAQSVLENPDRLRPTRPVNETGVVVIAGKPLELHVAPFAATEADLWVFDPATKTAIVGDLVVDLVPFMDSACPGGWLKALDEIERTAFVTLIPGHGPIMDRDAFLTWKAAFGNLVECGRSTADTPACVAGWTRDAARFIPENYVHYVKKAVAEYVNSRFRSPPAEQRRYCRPLG